MISRRIKVLIWIGAIGGILLIGLLTAISIMLPAYVQSRLIPELTRNFGLNPRQVGVRRIGWWGADLGPIRIEAGNRPLLTVAAIQIDYSPASLINGRIHGVALGGVRITLEVDEKGIKLPAEILPQKESEASAREGVALPDLGTLLPITLDKFSIRQSQVVLLWNQRRFSVPVDLELDGSRLSEGVLRADGQIAILGNPMDFTAGLDQTANQARVEFQTANLSLQSLVQTGQLPEGVQMRGSADIRAIGRVQLQPFEAALSLDAKIIRTRIAASQATITNASGHPAQELPIAIAVEAGSKTGIRWSCAPFQLQTPVAVRIQSLEGQWMPGQNGWVLDAEMDTRTAAQEFLPGLTLPRPMDMQWMAEVSQIEKNALAFKVKASAGQPLELKNELVRLTNAGASLDIHGRYAQGTLTAEATAKMKRLELKLADGRVTIPNPILTGKMALSPTDAEAGSEFSGRIDLSKVKSSFGSTQMRFAKFDIQSAGRRAPGDPWQFNADIRAAGGQASDTHKAVKASGIGLRLPLQWPPANARSGSVRVRSIQWDNRQLGDVKGILRQRSIGLDLDIKHTSKLFPDLIVLMNGAVEETGVRVDARLPAYRLPQGTDLGQFVPAASGLVLAGRIQGSGRLALKIGSIQSSGTLMFDEGSLLDASRDLDLKGIRVEMAMDDLINLTSGPRQTLRVEQLRFGKLNARALAVDFQLEPNRTFFIEKASLAWCDGRLNTAAIRVIPGKDDYDVTLSCDRLNLAMVLDQLGAADASGDGSVNGRIPLRWTGGRLSFDNGFLYSTPGQTGQIQIKGTEVLLSGLPPGTPQHTQLDIATEALKDYTYNWAKLSLNSDKDDLLLKLQFDGKPNRLLPFAYDKSLGQFKRVAGQGQADFKGISIDLNFNSPLNDIIHYQEFLKQN